MDSFDFSKVKSPIIHNTGRSSSPPPSSHEVKSASNDPKKHSPAISKPKTDEERLESLFHRILELDPEEHERRSILLNSALLFLPNSKAIDKSKNQSKKVSDSQQNQPKTDSIKTFSQPLMNLIFEVLLSVFSTPPPFSVITKSFRQIYFHSKDHPADVTACYKLFKGILPMHPTFPHSLLASLMHRMTSASNTDRSDAMSCLQSVDISEAPFLIHFLALNLIPPPPHGISDLLKLAVDILSRYHAPKPLFDDFFVTSSYDDNDNVRSIKSTVSESRLQDGITIFEELQTTFQFLHFAPHYQTFFDPLVEALKALHTKNEEFANQNRLFLLNHWPRLDPQKAVLFMKEATAICVHGPPVDEYVWQRLSWRSSSIQWQIATEGLNFVQQTIDKAKGFDMKILKFLLKDSIKTHWNESVRKKAEVVLELISEDEPIPPKTLPIDKWTVIREMASINFPGISFPDLDRKIKIIKKNVNKKKK